MFPGSGSPFQIPIVASHARRHYPNPPPDSTGSIHIHSAPVQTVPTQMTQLAWPFFHLRSCIGTPLHIHGVYLVASPECVSFFTSHTVKKNLSLNYPILRKKGKVLVERVAMIECESPRFESEGIRGIWWLGVGVCDDRRPWQIPGSR